MTCKIKDSGITKKKGKSMPAMKDEKESQEKMVMAWVPNKFEINTVVENLIKSNQISTQYASKIIQPKKINEQSLEKIGFVLNEKTLAIGKRLIVIDNESFGPTNEDRKDTTIGLGDMDGLRFDSKRYWSLDDDKKYLIYLFTNNKNSNLMFEILDYNLDDSEAFRVNDFYMPNPPSSRGTIRQISKRLGLGDENVLFGTQHWILIQSTKSLLEEKTKMKSNKEADELIKDRLWESYIKGNNNVKGLIQEKKVFYDHAFQLEVPFSKKEIEKFSGLNKPLFADINLEYNFLIKDYETSIKNVNEILIPNMYVISSEVRDDMQAKINGKLNANTYFDKIITMMGALDPTPFRMKPGMGQVADINTIDIVGDYFNSYAAKIRELTTPQNDVIKEQLRITKLQILEKLNEKLKYVGIPISNASILNEFYEKREMFPMYIDMQFSTDRTTLIAQVLKDSQMSSLLTLNMMQSDESKKGYEGKSFFEATEYIEEIKSDNGGVQLNKKYSFEKKERRTWNITNWMKDFDEQVEESSLNPNEILDNVEDIGIFLDQETEETTLNKNNSSYVFFRNLLKVIFIGKLRKIIKEQFRTYEDMMSGKLAYSETVLYRVEKKLANNKGMPIGNTIQNFYFPNANELDVLKFVDTQVKYGVQYVYTIYAYQSVIGTKYHYDDVTVKSNVAWFQVTQEPSILLVEVPYYTFNGAVVDDPPVAPDVDLIPYRGVNNEMLMFFNGGTGDYYLDPIIIEPNEKNVIDLYRRIKNYDPYEKIRYKSDDFIGSFQVYKTDVHPSNYSDFAGKLVVSVETDVDFSTPQGASSAAFQDRMTPNKKYWYCFRSIDFHGHFSNPSPIFQVQMIDNKGTVYPLIEVVDFKEKFEGTITKNMKRFIYIAPKFSQTIINETKMGIEDAISVKDVNNVYLGIAEKDVWGKDYLMRITSKQTGKIIEFVVNCDYRFSRKG